MKPAFVAAHELLALTRNGDYDRFLAIQLAPVNTRVALYTVTAFSVEIARIAETVSEPLIGHIRLAWWREALEEIVAGKTPRNHPVVLALADLYRTDAEVFAHLLTIIEARAADMDTSLIAQEAAWLSYCDNTAGALHLAWAIILGVECAQFEMIRNHARAYAMIGLVRAIPFMQAQGWLRFPHARMNAQHITELTPSDGLNALCAEVVRDAMGLLPSTDLKKLPKPLRAITTLARSYAGMLTRAGCNPYRLRPQKLRAAWKVMQVNIM